MRLIIFGVGEEYRKKKHLLPAADQIVAFLDNNSNLWGTQVDGKIYFGKMTFTSQSGIGFYGCHIKEIGWL